MPEFYPERSLRDVYYVLFRHKGKVIIFFLAVMITVTALTFLISETFRAEARLLVKIGRENVSLDRTATTGQVIQLGQNRESEINSELDMLKSRELAQKVVDAIGAQAFLEPSDEEISANGSGTGTSPEWVRGIRKELRETRKKFGSILPDLGGSLSEREIAIIKMMKDLDVETKKNTNTISLSYDGQSPKFAEAVLGRLIGFYLDKHITAHRTLGSYDFFDQQSKILRGDLLRTEEELKDLKDKTGVASLDDQRKIILNRLGALQQENEATQAALAISRSKTESIRRELAALSRTLVIQETKGMQNHAADLMRAKLFELQLKEQDLLSRYAKDSRQVGDVYRQIAEAQALLDKEEPTRTQVTTGINTTHQQLDQALLMETVTLSSLQSKAGVLEEQLKEVRRELKDLNAIEIHMVNLQRDLALQDSKYRKYSENREQARIDQALETKKISNISVVQQAIASTEPVKPRKALNLALGFFLGIFGGIGLAFFAEYTDHSLKTPQDIEEKLKKQVLAYIPDLKKDKLFQG